MATESTATETTTASGDKLQITKIVEGDIMCLRFIGTIDEDFDGQTLAGGVRGTLILDLGEVKRISSFGIREWVDFIKKVEPKTHAIYFIECSPKIIDQFNMVANFGGPGKVLSFYAPYRCDYCDDDRRRLVQVDESYELIQNMKLPDVPCPSCGNPEYFDEDPESFFTYLVHQPQPEPDPAVANFLASKLDYRVSDAARRLRVDKVVEDATFMKLSGDLDGAFPRNKLAEGLEGDVVIDLGAVGRVDDEGAAQWTAFVQELRGQARVLLLDCQPGFVERLFTEEALVGDVQVVSFFMPFRCESCGTTAAQRVETSEHFDVLKFATSPEFACPECGTRGASIASEEFLATLANLPRPTVDSELLEFASRAHEKLLRPSAGQQQLGGLAASAAPHPATSRTVGLATLAAVLASVLVVGGLAFLAYRQLKKEEQIRYDEGGTVVRQSHKEPPAWMKNWKTQPVRRQGDSYSIIGHSYSVKIRKKGSSRALQDATERLVHEVALSIEDAQWKEAILRQYRKARDHAFKQLAVAMGERDGLATSKAREMLWDRREAVHQAFEATAEDIPKSGDEFWQELKTSDGTRWQFWVRIVVPLSKMKGYAKQYTAHVQTQGVGAVDLFPGLAWVCPKHRQGAVVISVKKDSKWMLHGLGPGQVVLSCCKRKIGDARELKEVVEELEETYHKVGGRLECMTWSRGAQREVGYAVAKVEDPRPRVIPRRYGGAMRGGEGTGTENVNIWDDVTK